MFDDYKKVIITLTNEYCWYNVGETYDVKPYRHNPTDYWEINGWDGKNLEHVWIRKDHAEICKQYEWIDELFE